ncbi:MAG: hypothetical protein ACFFCS_16295 [Candidatus Hodarchaeota archaeon]
MTSENEITEKMDEAVDLLNCLDISNHKLEKIAESISGKIKSNAKLKEMITRLANSGLFGDKSDGSNQVSKLQDNIKKENMVPDLAGIIAELSKDPEIIENIEKDIIPLLFSD